MRSAVRELSVICGNQPGIGIELDVEAVRRYAVIV
jgi:hypothetical protein